MEKLIESIYLYLAEHEEEYKAWLKQRTGTQGNEN